MTMLPSSNPVNDITNAIQDAQTTGWEVVVALLVMVLAYPLARLARRLGRERSGPATARRGRAPDRCLLDGALR